MEYSQTITKPVICGIETNSSNDSRKIRINASRCYRIILQTEFSRGTRISLIVSQALFTRGRLGTGGDRRQLAVSRMRGLANT